MFDEATERQLRISKARSKVRDSLIGLNQKEKIESYVSIVKRHSIAKGCITNEELGLLREKDYQRLTREQELTLRTVYTLSAIGRLFKDKVSSFIPVEHTGNEQCGVIILLHLQILRKTEKGTLSAYSSEYLAHFLGGKCSAKRPRFVASIKKLIAERIRAVYKSSERDKEVKSELKNWVFKKAGKRMIFMNDDQYQVYLINKANNIVEIFDWKDLPKTPFNGEGIGFIGRDK